MKFQSLIAILYPTQERRHLCQSGSRHKENVLNASSMWRRSGFGTRWCALSECSSEQPLFLWLPHKGHNPISSVGYHRE